MNCEYCKEPLFKVYFGKEERYRCMSCDIIYEKKAGFYIVDQEKTYQVIMQFIKKDIIIRGDHMEKPICEKYIKCNCGRCKKLLTNKGNGCWNCANDANIPVCKKASEFVKNGILKEFDRHD